MVNIASSIAFANLINNYDHENQSNKLSLQKSPNGNGRTKNRDIISDANVGSSLKSNSLPEEEK